MQVVCYTAVLGSSRNAPPNKTLRDDNENGCVAD